MWLFLSLVFLWEAILEFKAIIFATLLAFLVLSGGQVALAGITWIVVYTLLKLFDSIK